jgi:hypothetical protein
VPGPVFAIHEQNVGITIIVVINEGAARTHGFGEPLFSEGAVVVGEMDSGWRRDVAENLLRGGMKRSRRQESGSQKG